MTLEELRTAAIATIEAGAEVGDLTPRMTLVRVKGVKMPNGRSFVMLNRRQDDGDNITSIRLDLRHDYGIYLLNFNYEMNHDLHALQTAD